LSLSLCLILATKRTASVRASRSVTENGFPLASAYVSETVWAKGSGHLTHSVFHSHSAIRCGSVSGSARVKRRRAG
jgi:hypothetical protein